MNYPVVTMDKSVKKKEGMERTKWTISLTLTVTCIETVRNVYSSPAVPHQVTIPVSYNGIISIYILTNSEIGKAMHHTYMVHK